VVVTHIHLDHAGGVGDIARAFPRATVYVHEKGARHLADPERLVAAAGSVYGDALDSLYGRIEPTPPDRLHALADGEKIDLGAGRALTTLYSPGHAKHHLALLDSETGVLFAGDAAGVRLPDVGVLWPTTPPDEFDLDLALGSLSLFAERHPRAVALAHFGLMTGDPAVSLDEAAEALRQWCSVAESAWRQGDGVEAVLQARFGAALSRLPAGPRSTMERLDGIRMNASGLEGWLARTKLADRGSTAGPASR